MKNWKLSRKLGMLVVLAIVGVVVSIAIGLMQLREHLLQDRMLKTRHVVEVALGVISHFQKLEQEASFPPTRCVACATKRPSISSSTIWKTVR